MERNLDAFFIDYEPGAPPLYKQLAKEGVRFNDELVYDLQTSLNALHALRGKMLVGKKVLDIALARINKKLERHLYRSNDMTKIFKFEM